MGARGWGVVTVLVIAATACGDDAAGPFDAGRDARPTPSDARVDEDRGEPFDAGSDGSTTDAALDVGVLDDAALDGTEADAAGDAGAACVDDRGCEDGDPCTVDTCSGGHCANVPVDRDGDGFPAMTVSGRACAGGVDCDDTQRIVHPGAEEVCDGADDNCDGVGDAGGRLGDDIRLATGTNPAIVWGGDRYGLVWNDAGGLYFATLPASGAPLSAPRLVREADDNARARIVWTGSEFGVVAADCRLAAPRCMSGASVYLDRLSTTGEVLGSTLVTTSGSSAQGVTWTGAEYGIVWVDFRDERLGEIYFARVAADGTRLGGDVRVTTNPEVSMSPTIAWTGSEYGIAWTDARDAGWEIYFTRISAAGDLVAESDRRITDALDESAAGALLWDGTAYALVWTDSGLGGTSHIFFANLDATGELLGRERPATPDGASQPSLVRQADRYALAWTGGTGATRAVFLSRLTSMGGSVAPDELIAASTGGSFAPSIAWTGAELGLAWMDDRDTTSGTSVYFARVAPCEF